ncbi:MAG TPA: Holliday junction branch migration protein RuvA [Gammaproteobacteria bacterium]|nr:Holliday junction branch migration protein RuvA [Gammaproteobacteria bacterium]
MIGFLRGKLLAKSPPSLLLDVHGVGYEVEAPMTTFYDLPEIGAEVVLHTHLVVREDAHVLYGFTRATDRALFRSLLRVNGVGARLALAILSGMEAGAFTRCVHEGDTAALTRLPGVGRKTAERLVVEMRDRLPGVGGGDGERGTVERASEDPVEEAVGALMALGYKPQEASRMVRAVEATGLVAEEIIRRALQASVR